MDQTRRERHVTPTDFFEGQWLINGGNWSNGANAGLFYLNVNNAASNSNTNIESLDWAVCIEKYDRPHSLFYCDPPYWGTEGYGVDFGLHEYQRMAELAKRVSGRMIISVNDIPEMRNAFDGLTIERVEIGYTVGGAAKAKSGELIIRNW